MLNLVTTALATAQVLLDALKKSWNSLSSQYRQLINVVHIQVEFFRIRMYSSRSSSPSPFLSASLSISRSSSSESLICSFRTFNLSLSKLIVVTFGLSPHNEVKVLLICSSGSLPATWPRISSVNCARDKFPFSENWLSSVLAILWCCCVLKPIAKMADASSFSPNWPFPSVSKSWNTSLSIKACSLLSKSPVLWCVDSPWSLVGTTHPSAPVIFELSAPEIWRAMRVHKKIVCAAT